MSFEINPKDVLEYLNDLGYTNITAQQLKQFIKDLKKLMKHEVKLALKKNEENEDKENEIPNIDNINSTVFINLHQASTASSRAKMVTKKESIISVQVNRPPKENIVTNTSVKPVQQKPPQEFYHVCQNFVCVPESPPSATETSIKTKSEVKQSKPSKDIDMKPRSSFIRPRQLTKPCKSDPVALYHYYQEEWKRQKIPGTAKRANLRWAMRERMLGEPEVSSHSKNLR